jgi:hypothetical protein
MKALFTLLSTPGRKGTALDRSMLLLAVVGVGLALDVLTVEEAKVVLDGVAMVLGIFVAGNGVEHVAGGRKGVPRVEATQDPG